MKKNWLYSILMAIPLMSGLTACNNEDDPNPNPNPNPEPTTTYGAYIVNTGNWGANDGFIQWFDMEKQTVSGDLYQAQNGKGIGDVSPDESVFFHFLRFVFSIPAVPAARARFFSLYVSILTVPQNPSRMKTTALQVPGWFRAGR